MGPVMERLLVGLDCLSAVTVLLARVRNAHPTSGRYEAADLQWWWRQARSTDHVRQLFWFDDHGHPLAAALLTDWGDGVALDPIVMPQAPPAWIEHVLDRGLEHAAGCGVTVSDIEVDADDQQLIRFLGRYGFAPDGDASEHGTRTHLVEAWLSSERRPATRPLPERFELRCRAEMQASPHHMVRRSGPDVEARLRQTSLYDPARDLLVVDPLQRVAAYALFWFDPQTATGLVEPMRTEDDYQRRGLAQHLLTVGVARLFDAGARRVKVCFEPDNAGAQALYVGAGFRPMHRTVLLRRAVGTQVAA